MDNTFKKGFVLSLPVLIGYLFLGSTFGILLVEKGYPFWYAPIMSLFIYAGSGQIVAVSLLSLNFDLWHAFILTVIINARHIFYGISMLPKFKGTGRIKPLLIFTLTDETFAILQSQVYKEESKTKLMATVALLDHLYWIIGGTLGALFYSLVKFNTNGIEFVLTALFIVIMTEQFLSIKNKFLAPLGIIITIISILIFGDNFMLPALGFILILCMILKKPFTNLEGECY